MALRWPKTLIASRALPGAGSRPQAGPIKGSISGLSALQRYQRFKPSRGRGTRPRRLDGRSALGLRGAGGRCPLGALDRRGTGLNPVSHVCPKCIHSRAGEPLKTLREPRSLMTVGQESAALQSPEPWRRLRREDILSVFSAFQCIQRFGGAVTGAPGRNLLRSYLAPVLGPLWLVVLAGHVANPLHQSARMPLCNPDSYWVHIGCI